MKSAQPSADVPPTLTEKDLHALQRKTFRVLLVGDQSS